KKIPIPGKYNIYIFGLNDAINTTEFLEENYNASLDVFVWNYRSHSWDKLCERRKYGKEDGINAGTITPDNISVDGDFRLKLISHDVAETGLRDRPIDGMRTVRRRQTGYAWFNYALITPVPVLGRVNINTASARLLSALPGMSQQLAQNVYLGVDGTGRMTLKPYQRLGDILKVRGMTVPVFERCANMLCVDSQSFTVDVEAETIKDVNRNGTFDQDVDKVAAEKRRRYVVQAPHLLQEGQQTARIVEKYTP
ncbi:helix-hairpin-helix domain-containing protein, partial [bacterium]|nr:helix-hairpin-helix domain-containing protein [bacterium]